MSGLDEFLDAKPLSEDELRAARLRRFGRDGHADEHVLAEPELPADGDEGADWLDEPMEPVLFDGDSGALAESFEDDDTLAEPIETAADTVEAEVEEAGEPEAELGGAQDDDFEQIEPHDASEVVGDDDWADANEDDWYPDDDDFEGARTLDEVMEEPVPELAPEAPEPDAVAVEEDVPTDVVAAVAASERTPARKTAKKEKPRKLTQHEQELEEVKTYVKPDGSLPTLGELRTQRKRNTVVALAAMFVLLLVIPVGVYVGHERKPRVERDVITRVVPGGKPAQRRRVKPSTKRPKRTERRVARPVREVPANPAPAPVYRSVPAQTGAGVGDLAPGGVAVD